MLLSEADILGALEKIEFFPVFQPLVELRTGQLAGFEMLARWMHPEHGLIPPDQFIPAVEKHGKIDALMRMLLEKAFTEPVISNSILRLSVNISPAQLLNSRLPQRIQTVAERARFSLNRLTIEITESALLDDLDRAQSVARRIKELGCKLALDDFGTGYSSLRHIHTLPFDELKVDRSFVRSMTRKRESRKIVAAVIGLGQSLGVTTVAEGVETREQARMLFYLGCDLGQGWLYGKPVPAEDLVRVLAEPRRLDPIPVPLGQDSIMSIESLPAQRLAQLQAIYDGAPVGLCFLDRKMRYVSLNRRLSEMNGAPAADHLGRTVAEVIPHVFAHVEPYIRRALQGEPVNGVEIQKPPVTPGGEGQSLMLSYQPVRDEAGEVLGVSVAVMDITERKHTEAALHESEEHFRHMMLLGPHVPWVLDTKGEVIEASPRWQGFTGQPVAKALGNGWLKVLHPEDVAPTQEAIRVSLDTGQPIDIEYRVKHPDGMWRWMRARGAPRFGPTGKIVCIYGVAEEVHSQKKATEELEARVAALRSAMGAVPIGMVLANAHDCSIYMVNPTAHALFQGALFPGQTFTEYSSLHFNYPDGRPMPPGEFPLARSIRRGETVEHTLVLYARADGAEIRLELASKPIYADSGELIGGLMLVRDL